jgi:NAD+ diphosphatase
MTTGDNDDAPALRGGALDAPLVLDRAAHLRKDVDFLQAELRAPGSVILPAFRDVNLVAGERIALLPIAEASSLLDHDGELVWLGKLAQGSCFAIDLSALPDPLAHPALRERGELRDLRMAGATLRQDHAALALYARGLLYWHTRQRHCGVCGAPTAARSGGHTRVCRNEGCKTEHFPRTDPAIIVLVTSGDDCLLGRQPRWPAGMYSTLAGFVEPGETIEQAVAREVHEESGVRVQSVEYFRSQPWPFPASLMLGFNAIAATREINVDGDELEDAKWFSKEHVRDAKAHGFWVPGSFSLSGQLIEAWLAEST